MRIAITGGTGFVGTALTELLINNGHEVVILTRKKPLQKSDSRVEYIQWLSDTGHADLPVIDAIVNLAGASINNRWTENYKQKIISSRVEATKEVINLIENSPVKPKVLINASAIGYYGTSTDRTFTEETDSAGDDFLASVVTRWEQEALKAEAYGVRVVCTRFGLILGKGEGALPKLVQPYKLYAGGPLGSGEQWYSWVHIDDVVGLIYFAILTNQLRGPVNAVAPTPVTMEDFGRALAKVLNRPHWLPTPAFILKLLLGEMSVLVLEGQRVIPEKALKHNYKFKYADINLALSNLLK
ncbi:TIGR01777 family oxidoreductase [Desulfuribacillus alkaliarsenatis]|uniref:TIGR01777 family protein n=1 Tax=Desulfuribacillus alkaliarsenatis TaxID=766136 RepID=A0A1E5G5Q8_9FIRM|nr:TIGR01777 family oxidoreductase [Desulfuribacillus alkaliarsenatis]OEF98521.1 TIGR01777 family protein [Desulfuribacillus alkaliarsenatis]